MTSTNLLQSVRAVLACASLCAFSSWANADTRVLGFEDLAVAGELPASYGGVDWSASSWIGFNEPQTPYTPHSGTWRVATDFGSSNAASTIRFIESSVFDGAWFSGFSDATVTVQMYLGDALVATSATLTPSATPSFLASGYSGLVDRLVFLSPQQAFYAMDDFTYTTAVPEPQGWLLMGAGLVLLARRRNAHRQA